MKIVFDTLNVVATQIMFELAIAWGVLYDGNVLVRPILRV
jgi:hypothetical protein